ncbi:hypothetical protein HJFPF1_08237 [Paramyrothecium foliicola]|nr:hypothetical protein HJFPF1_08237 [Paramyrothecium foliicola]
METAATTIQSPRKGILRDETIIIRHLFGFNVDHRSSIDAEIMKLPFVAITANSTSTMRHIRLLSIDIDKLQEIEQVIEQFHVGVSYLDTQSLQKWLVNQNRPDITRANDPIVTRYFVVGGKDCHSPRRKPYLFGEPQNLSLDGFKEELRRIVSSVSDHVLLCHGSDREISVLQRLKICLDSLCIIDTVKAAQYPLDLSHRSSLQGLLDELKIPFAYLHNAGNDAYFVLRAFLMLAVRDAERESESIPKWVPVVKIIAQAPWPLIKDGKMIQTKRKPSKWQPRSNFGNDTTDLNRPAMQ